MTYIDRASNCVPTIGGMITNEDIFSTQYAVIEWASGRGPGPGSRGNEGVN